VSNHAPLTSDFALLVSPSDRARASRIEVRGELDSGTAPELMEAVRRALESRSTARLTLDLGPMTFIDSAGTRALIMIERQARDRRVGLEVLPPPERVTELLRTAGVADHIGLATADRRPRTAFLQRTELELPRQPRSPALARAEVREALGACEESLLAGVVLLTSELVTNAVVHPRRAPDTPIGLRIITYPDGVRVEVEDAGEGFDHVAVDLPEGERGRGLFLVDRFATRWGSERVQTDAGRRFRVWFELDWEARREGRVV